MKHAFGQFAPEIIVRENEQIEFRQSFRCAPLRGVYKVEHKTKNKAIYKITLHITHCSNVLKVY
jgi:hypothetical protein